MNWLNVIRKQIQKQKKDYKRHNTTLQLLMNTWGLNFLYLETIMKNDRLKLIIRNMKLLLDQLEKELELVDEKPQYIRYDDDDD